MKLQEQLNELVNKYSDAIRVDIEVLYDARQCAYRINDEKDISFIVKALGNPEVDKVSIIEDWGTFFISIYVCGAYKDKVETPEIELEEGLKKLSKFKMMMMQKYPNRTDDVNKLMGQVISVSKRNGYVLYDTIVKYFDLAMKSIDTPKPVDDNRF